VLLAAVLAACAPVPPPRPGGYHASDAPLTVTRLAHAGVLLDFAGRRFLADPWIYEGLLHRFREPLGLHPDAFPPIAAVLLTDGASGRFDATGLARLARTIPRAVAPAALVPRLRALGFREVVALAWWHDVEIDGVRITATPARGNGYLLRRDALVVALAGEPGETPAAADVRRQAGHVDVALVPIGGPRRFGRRSGMDARDAAAVAVALDARRMVPLAYGAAGTPPIVTFSAAPLERLRDAARDAGLPAATLVVLEPGESWHVYP
jgi:L-ascorbate metabolism protein UlaG (beta-lactamase superfamily)